MFRQRLTPLALVAVLSAAGVCPASPITIEPDNYADGTVLNNISSAVTLFTSVIPTDLTSNFGFNVTAQTDFGFMHTSTGSKVFAHVGIPFFNSSRNLRMTFASPIAQLALDFIPDSSEVGTLALYDSNGVLLATFQTTNPQADVPQTLSFLRNTADVKYVVASGTGAFIRLDNLRFDAAPAVVPEPASVVAWGLLGLTAAAVTVARRGRRCTAAV